ncbi:hypothetical protein [Cellulomonas sp. Root137]|uniref:hypothetical protein n=1 Tax=Cellulomonas sp. Root137 TaxID=1736459 RepID=UPI0006F51383|nr:hypothetical protein [Cellulomonas sp. Root137]KQY43110.1 hypothetical protein ASD18_19325 [Cellulomonas sp. Root137]
MTEYPRTAPTELLALVDELAPLVHMEDVRDWQDEHVRWEAYLRALERPETHDLLRRTLYIEPDPSVATSAVLERFRTCSREERAIWITAIPEERREIPIARARDLTTLEDLQSGELVPSDSEIINWSRWLQNRVAEQSSDEAVLASIAAHGHGRRTRNIATERLRISGRKKRR